MWRRTAIVGGADADGIVGDGGPALHQSHAFGPQLFEVTLFRGQAHAVEEVEGVEASATFEDISDSQSRVGMSAGIERARVPCRPVGAGHREGERLAPQLPTTLVGLAPGGGAWRPADPAHRAGSCARALRAAPTSALAAVAAAVVAGRTAATEDRNRDGDGRLALGAAATTVAARPNRTAGRPIGRALSNACPHEQRRRDSAAAFSPAARARQQQHRPQPWSGGPSAAPVKATIRPRPCEPSVSVPSVLVPTVSASRVAWAVIAWLTASGGELGGQRLSFRDRRNSQNAPGGNPNSGAKAHRR